MFISRPDCLQNEETVKILISNDCVRRKLYPPMSRCFTTEQYKENKSYIAKSLIVLGSLAVGGAIVYLYNGNAKQIMRNINK